MPRDAFYANSPRFFAAVAGKGAGSAIPRKMKIVGLQAIVGAGSSTEQIFVILI